MQCSNGGDFRSKASLSLQQPPCPGSFPMCFSLLCCLYKLTQELHYKYHLKQGFLPKLSAFMLVGFCAEAASGLVPVRLHSALTE